ncbi:hypothetical protein Amsp01_090490 [Amycolatopsis sp. NBRC 101858]|nr:hypothetical protein Amsp01_090490 [Amycolatopsis sp. NBRC 101858]
MGRIASAVASSIGGVGAVGFALVGGGAAAGAGGFVECRARSTATTAATSKAVTVTRRRARLRGRGGVVEVNMAQPPAKLLMSDQPMP